MANRDLISQQESAETSSTTVKKYDFKKALRLSMEHIRVLTKIHENYAYQLSSIFSSQYRSIVHVEVAAVEQISYEEFIQQLPAYTVLSVYEVVGQEQRLALNLHPRMASAFIDRLLGGRGTLQESDEVTITPIETNVLKRLLEDVIQSLQKAWVDIFPVKLKTSDVETNPQFLQLVNPTEPVVVLSFSIMIGDKVEQMRICIPYVVIEPFVGKLSVQLRQGKEQKDEKQSEVIQDQIEHLMVPVSAELGRASITIDDFLGLAVNDVIQLDQLVDEPLKVKINEQVKFLAHPGTKKSRMAIKIEHVIEGEERNDG